MPDAILPDIVRTCGTCDVEKAISEFRTLKKGKRGRVYYSTLHTCRACERLVSRKYYAANKDKWADSYSHIYQVARYGITPDDYATMLELQDGRCAVCKRVQEGQRLAVDHDHVTGKVRGLLCNQCNRGIGLLGDSPELLLSAVNYLRKAGESDSLADQ
jgi:hypothetical protein